jgi:hypothetical protein
MPYPPSAYELHQRKRWLRHDMHLWIRHDAARWVKPGTDQASALAEEHFEWMGRGTTFPALFSTDLGD